MSDRPPTRSENVRRLSSRAFITQKYGLRGAASKQRSRTRISGRYVSRSTSSRPTRFK